MDPKHGTVFGVSVMVAGGLIVNAVDAAIHPLGDPPIALAGLPINSTVSTLHNVPIGADAVTGQEYRGPLFDVRPGSNLRQP
ncbi:MAG: hypothetical protein Q8P46_10480 [Hyphomicrobiales bacterium]|nr:hypothetical protein [Hyphomicrobiales bacterium]